jgi:DNA sulfur modification protein DndC
MSQCLQQTIEMSFENDTNKLSIDSVEKRDELVRIHANNPKAAFYVSTSGGADSQAMYAYVKKMIPAERIFLVHANLGVVEHKGIVSHIVANSVHKLEVVRNDKYDFLDMVLLRGKWPSSKFRNCTSTLKTGPIFSHIKAHSTLHGFTTVFNISGLRSDESTKRAGKNPLWLNKDLTLKSGARDGYDWLPIFHISKEEAFKLIVEDGQFPYAAYGEKATGGDTGNDRISCIFCIMGSKNDLRRGAVNYVDHYAQMVALEQVIQHTMFGKTRVIHTDRLFAKNDSLQGGVVTESYKSKLKHPIMPFTCKIFIPTPLNEWVGVPVDDVAVKRHYKLLKMRQFELMAAKALEANNKAKEQKVSSGARKHDKRTIDIEEVA